MKNQIILVLSLFAFMQETSAHENKYDVDVEVRGVFEPVNKLSAYEEAERMKELKRIRKLSKERKIESVAWHRKKKTLTEKDEKQILEKYGDRFKRKAGWRAAYAFTEVMYTSDISDVFLTLMKHGKIDPNQNLKANKKKQISLGSENVRFVVSSQEKPNIYYTPLFGALSFDKLSYDELKQFLVYGAEIKNEWSWHSTIAELSPRQYELVKQHGFVEKENFADIVLYARNAELLKYLERNNKYPNPKKITKDTIELYARWLQGEHLHRGFGLDRGGEAAYFLRYVVSKGYVSEQDLKIAYENL